MNNVALLNDREWKKIIIIIIKSYLMVIDKLCVLLQLYENCPNCREFAEQIDFHGQSWPQKFVSKNV